MRFQPPNVVAMVRHPHQHPLELSYLNGFSYGIGMSMLSLLVPLYIIRLGFSLADMGLVVSSAAVFMIVLRLLGGAVSDRFGETARSATRRNAGASAYATRPVKVQKPVSPAAATAAR